MESEVGQKFGNKSMDKKRCKKSLKTNCIDCCCFVFNGKVRQRFDNIVCSANVRVMNGGLQYYLPHHLK
jgi:hypothetical protein